MSALQVFTVSSGDDGLRLDLFLARVMPGISRRAAGRLIGEGAVLVDGVTADKGLRLQSGHSVSVPDQHDLGQGVIPDPEMAIEILHLDADVVVVNKPAGIHTHPLDASERGTLAGFLVAKFPETASVGHSSLEPGVLHRLDQGTSGVVLAARNSAAFEELKKQFKSGRVTKTYFAVVQGETPDTGSIQMPLKKSGPRGEKVVVVKQGEAARIHPQPAVTNFWTFGHRAGCSLCEIVIPTGVRHQIRVHMAAIGHPLVNDALYGSALPVPGLEPGRHLLHAWKIAFDHPVTGERIIVESQMPEDMKRFWEKPVMA